jgi:hypothetical protein
MDNFFSQAGQDKWVVEFFKFKENGFFLDIGAYDGIEYSNSYYLEKNLNWNGICIEANPTIYKKLISNRNCECLNVAVTDYSGKANFISDGLTGRINDFSSSTYSFNLK